MKKPINHKSLGGDVVDFRKPLPQRKPNKSMTPEQLLNKAFYGTSNPLTNKERRDQEWGKIADSGNSNVNYYKKGQR